MITIVDYGMGNLRSVQKAIEKVGYQARIASSPDEVRESEALVLPGVGAFGDAMDRLRESGLASAATDVALSGRPFLGVCLGMQLLFTESTETFDDSPSLPGLGLVPGRVVRFDVADQGLKVPQMGWNSVMKTRNPGIMAPVPEGAYFYFVHSYHVVPDDPAVVSTWTDHGGPFASSLAHGNVFATQFHPEKSSRWGLEIYRAFGALVTQGRS